MTDKQTPLDTSRILAEDVSPEKISEELRIMKAVRRGRTDVAAGRSKSQQETEKLVKSWVSAKDSQQR